MSNFNKLIGIAMVLFFCLFMSKTVFSAEEEKIVDGMNQGDFAMLLIKELDAQSYLPVAATVKDGFKFLEKLGVVPPDGWDEEATITSEILASMLGLEKGTYETLTFEELLDSLEKKLADILWSMGIRSVDPLTISPAGG